MNRAHINTRKEPLPPEEVRARIARRLAQTEDERSGPGQWCTQWTGARTCTGWLFLPRPSRYWALERCDGCFPHECIPDEDDINDLDVQQLPEAQKELLLLVLRETAGEEEWRY